ncbi:Spc98 family-domain-containing protein [Schizophyllum commune]
MLPSNSAPGLGRPPRSQSSAGLRRASGSGIANQRRASGSSTLGVPRPQSSASVRPGSRLSIRPQARHARNRLLPLCQKLVTHITGNNPENDDDAPQHLQDVEFVLKNLEANKQATTVDLDRIDRQIRGLVQKARINNQDALADALQKSAQRLKDDMVQLKKDDLDSDIRSSNIPAHIHFLISMSNGPSPVSLAYAEHYLEEISNPVAPPRPTTWLDIIGDEPFEGEHWKGVYGLPSGFVRESDADSLSDGSAPSLSTMSDDPELNSLNDSFSSAEEAPILPTTPPAVAEVPLLQPAPKYTYTHRQAVEELRARQYWTNHYKSDVNHNKPFDIGNAATFGGSMQRAVARGQTVPVAPEVYIDEVDMVREVLIGLQGRHNIMFIADMHSCPIRSDAPRLAHLSLGSQQSILQSFCQTASVLYHLRTFVSFVLAQVSDRQPQRTSYIKPKAPIRTLEAFADAVAEQLRGFDAWCASREQDICCAREGVGAGMLVVSLLSTEKALRDRYERAFSALLNVVNAIGAESEQGRWKLPVKGAARNSAVLLDALLSAYRAHIEIGEAVTADALLAAFQLTAEPVWGMIHLWLRDGMDPTGKELDDEFFIEGSGLGVGMMGMGMLDPDFWADAYTLRDDIVSDNGEDPNAPARKVVPAFLAPVAEMVLGAGKGIGLLRALGDEPEDGEKVHLDNWRSFGDLVAAEAKTDLSADTLAHAVYDALSPHCAKVGRALVSVVRQDFEEHLAAIEGLYLMRRGDTIAHFADLVFEKMDAQQSWADFHFINTCFTDVVERTKATSWIQPALVRLSYRGGKEKERSISRTVRALDGLNVGYSVPFPVIYVFRPKTIQTYNNIFVFLLQIMRAKSVLERILFRGDSKHPTAMMKVFYALRGKMSWFINALLNFFTTYVIHSEVLRFRKRVQDVESLDHLIILHEEHIERIEGRCLLQPKTSALHRAVLSILDLSLSFSQLLVSVSGDANATLDISRQSLLARKHRSRHQRRMRRNVIGFGASAAALDSSSDEDEDENEGGEADLTRDAPSTSLAVSGASVVGEWDPLGGVEKISTELDGLVRFIRRGVDSLAGGTSEAASAFGVLSFVLEDWDL